MWACSPYSFRLGQRVGKMDLTRFVRWPLNIRVQRQKAILKKRMKVPPVVNQFSKTLDKSTGS